MKHINYIILLSSVVALASCSDDDETFSLTATQRLQQRLDDTDKLLTEAKYGWAMDYYPDANITYGGIAYTISFDGLNATVRSEIEPGKEAKSLYRFKGDNGPVLSFDTYNPLMHFFATPSAEEYQAKDGDFEFLIDSLSTDVIKLHGKRNGNTVYLHRLTMPANEYIQKVDSIQNIFYIDKIEVGTESGIISTDDRRLYWGNDDEEGTPFVFTNSGIRFYNSVDIAGEKVDQLNYDEQKLILTDPSTNIKLDARLTKTYFNTCIEEGLDNNAHTFELKHKGAYSISTKAKWISIDENGEKITIRIEENKTNHLRNAWLHLDIKDKADSLLITQFDFDNDIIGNYKLQFFDSDNNENICDATLMYDADGNIILDVPELEYTFPMQFDEKAIELGFLSHCYVGSFTNSKGTTYYLGTQLMTKEMYWTSHYSGYAFSGKVIYDEDSETCYIEFNKGEVYGYKFVCIQIGAYSDQSITSSTYLGWFDRIWNPILIKE